MNPSAPLDNKLPGTSDLDEEAIPEVTKRTQTLQDEAESRDHRLRVEEIKAVSRGI